MPALDQILNDAPAAAAAGGLMVAVRAAFAFLPGAAQHERLVVYAMLHDMIWGTPELTYRERKELEELIKGGRNWAPSVAHSDMLLQLAAERIPTDETEITGRVHALFAATRNFLGKPLGVVHPLVVTAKPWGNTIDLILPAAHKDPVLRQAFRNGALAAFNYILQQNFEVLYGAILFDTYKIEGYLPTLRTLATGESFGLASAIGILSALLEIPVPANVSFSSQIDVSGSLTPVRDLEAKLSAAADCGIKRVFVAADQPLPAETYAGVEIVPLGTLSSVISKIFSSDAITAGVERLKGLQAPAWANNRYWRITKEIPVEAPRILLSAIGKSDPFGIPKDSHGRDYTQSEGICRICKQKLDRDDSHGGSYTQSEGPCLVAARHVHPTVAYLFYTTASAAGKYNDFAENTAETERCLQEQPGGCDVRPIELDELSDPTDLEQLLPIFSKHAVCIVAEHGDNAAYFINLTTGTKQMQIMWHLLVERRTLPGTLLQIREQRYVETGKEEPIVRPVVLPRW